MNDAARKVESQLERLTPSAAGLPRDEILFAAGRASARPSVIWKIVAGLFAAGQCVTLALLLLPGRPLSMESTQVRVMESPAALSPEYRSVDPMVMQARQTGELPPAASRSGGSWATPTGSSASWPIRSELLDF